MMICRGIRGATTIEEDTPQAIFDAVGELLQAMIGSNDIEEEDVASVIHSLGSSIPKNLVVSRPRDEKGRFLPLSSEHKNLFVTIR